MRYRVMLRINDRCRCRLPHGGMPYRAIPQRIASHRIASHASLLTSVCECHVRTLLPRARWSLPLCRMRYATQRRRGSAQQRQREAAPSAFLWSGSLPLTAPMERLGTLVQLDLPAGVRNSPVGAKQQSRTTTAVLLSS